MAYEVAGHLNLEPLSQLRLEMPPEPVELREWMRSVILSGGDPRKDFSNDVCLGMAIWERWRSALEPAGLGPRGLRRRDRVLRARDLVLDHRGTPMGAVHRRARGSRRTPPSHRLNPRQWWNQSSRAMSSASKAYR